MFGLQVGQGRRKPCCGNERPWLCAAERVESTQRHRERRPADQGQRVVNVVGDGAIDVADEAERDVVVIDIDPARAAQAATDHAEFRGKRLGQCETREEARHRPYRKAAVPRASPGIE